MFAFLKKKLQRNSEKHQGFHYAQQWKQNPLLQDCFATLRGSFTVAQAYHQEALEAAVAIALTEDSWSEAAEIPADFLGDRCYIFWNDPTLPVLLCHSPEVLASLPQVCAVSKETFLISETMDRIIYFKDNGHKLYSIA